MLFSTSVRILDPRRIRKVKKEKKRIPMMKTRTKEAVKRTSLPKITSNVIFFHNKITFLFITFSLFYKCRDGQEKSETESEGSQQTGKDFEMIEKDDGH